MKNELINVQIDTKDGVNVVSSRVIAKELGKQHYHVTRDIENIINSNPPNMEGQIILSNYEHRGNIYKEYLLTKDAFTLYMFNIQGYNDFKMAYINKFNEMEKALVELNNEEQQKANLLLAVYNGGVEGVQATKQLVDIEAKKIAEPLLEKIEEDKPKVDRYESWINTDKTYTATQMVKLFKDSDITNASKLNIKLHELRLQYKQGRVWLPFAEVDKDLYELKVNKYGVQLRWTTRGVVKISEILNIELDREQLQ